jgi:hypothetical protein
MAEGTLVEVKIGLGAADIEGLLILLGLVS